MLSAIAAVCELLPSVSENARKSANTAISSAIFLLEWDACSACSACSKFSCALIGPPAPDRSVCTMIAELGSAQEAAISRKAIIGRGDGRSRTLQANVRCRRPYRSALLKAKRDQEVPGWLGG